MLNLKVLSYVPDTFTFDKCYAQVYINGNIYTVWGIPKSVYIMWKKIQNKNPYYIISAMKTYHVTKSASKKKIKLDL